MSGQGSNPLFGPRARLTLGRPFTEFKPGTLLGSTVVQRLNPYADQIRDIATRLGARPYRVILVWTRWSGGERGVGVEEVIREEPLLPTPQISTLNGIDQQVMSIGAEEVGGLKVTELPPRFSEDYLQGLAEDGCPIEPDQNFYWEIFFPRPDGSEGPRRRFVMKTTPSYQATDFEWTVDLVKAIQDRDRAGNPAP